MTAQTLLGRGIYDVDELAHIVGASPRRVESWALPSRDGDPLLYPVDQRLFSFHDLITGAIAQRLQAERDVPLPALRRGRSYLESVLGTRHPFAHEDVLHRLATVGLSLFWDSNGEKDWLDVSLGGQEPISLVVAPLLRAVDFGPDHLVSRWKPHEGVLVDPTVQTGSPCVQGTRVPTAMLFDLHEGGDGDTVDDIASDYGLSVEQVQKALDWESALAPAA